MAQSIYDDPDFFAAYSALDRSVRGLDGAPEWPVLRAMVGGVTGRRIVDLGCGFGWFCRYAVAGGAESVLGLDLSERMLERAQADTDDPRITYRRVDLDRLELPDAVADLAFSSLVVHYLTDLDGLVAAVRRALVPGGAFVFSVEHPIYTAPTFPGFLPGADGRPAWPVDAYHVEGPRTTTWLAPGVVKQHRTISTYVSCLLRHGFTLTGLREWGPSPDQVREHPEWASEVARPMFLLLSAVVGGRG